MNKLNKILLTVLAVGAMATSNIMAVDVVNEGTFDTEAATRASWAAGGTGGGWTDAANVSPISGGYLWFNSAGYWWNQAFDGITLEPNTLYAVSFDAIALAAAQTVDVGLLYMTGSSNLSAVSGYLSAADLLNFTHDSTWAASGDANWYPAGRFTCPLAPGADDPLSSHYFQFNTPNVLNGPAGKFGVTIRNASGIQVRLDNVKVDVIAIPEPVTFGLLFIWSALMLSRVSRTSKYVQ